MAEIAKVLNANIRVITNEGIMVDLSFSDIEDGTIEIESTETIEYEIGFGYPKNAKASRGIYHAGLTFDFKEIVFVSHGKVTDFQKEVRN